VELVTGMAAPRLAMLRECGDARDHTCMPLSRMLTFPTVATCRQSSPASFAPLLSALLGILLLVPLLPSPSDGSAALSAAAERQHDRVNMVVLTPLCIGIVGSWLCLIDPYVLTLGVVLYVVWDVLYLLTHATAVRTRRIILAHHIVTLIFALVPLHHDDIAEFTAIAGGAELQTLALIVRRRLRDDASASRLLLRVASAVHDTLFVVIRLVLHPLLLVGMCMCMQVPRMEGSVVITCQSLLCVFNCILWGRERRRAWTSGMPPQAASKKGCSCG